MIELLYRRTERDWDEAKHPRDPAGSPSGGQFSGGGGGGDGGGGHPGAGYSKHAKLDSKGVIHTTKVEDAVRALYEGKKVELNQPKQVSTLIQRLGNEAKRFQELGHQAPVFNLCDVSVAGTNLFCVESKGIPRVNMPQMDEKQTKEFVRYLKDKGYKVKKGDELAANLRATQNELNGAKVAKNMDRIDANPSEGPRLVISKDDYILDGHHRWAAKLGIDMRDDNLTDDSKMQISRVNIDIIKLLEEAEKFTGGKGHVSVAASYRKVREQLQVLFHRYDPPPVAN
jgi:hypothetical protein